MKKNKTLMIVLGVFALVIITTGASFAFFQYQRTGNTRVNVTSGDIQFSYMDDNQDASLANAFPVADSVGAVDITGEYEFTVNLTSSSSSTIANYNVSLVSDNNETKNYFTNDQIKFALVKNNVFVAGTSSTKGLKLSEISGFTNTTTNGEGVVLANQEIIAGQTDTYKLRIWISDDVSYNNTINDGVEAGKYNGYSYSLKVKVSSSSNQITYGKATDVIMNLATTQLEQIRVDNHEATGQQDFATTEYRYYGATPNNYVTFNNELWRIIGAFDVDDGEGNVEKRLKIIRVQSIGNMKWNTNAINQWATSTLNSYLNGEYFTSLTSAAQSMIGNSVYYLGGHSTYGTISNTMYTAERGTVIYSEADTKITSKIALMYPSDYGYAAGITCDTTNLNSYLLSCKSADWLFNGTIQWTLSPHSSYATIAFRIFSDGNIGSTRVDSDNCGILPVAYLKSNVKITEGNGNSQNPFQLSL